MIDLFCQMIVFGLPILYFIGYCFSVGFFFGMSVREFGRIKALEDGYLPDECHSLWKEFWWAMLIALAWPSVLIKSWMDYGQMVKLRKY